MQSFKVMMIQVVAVKEKVILAKTFTLVLPSIHDLCRSRDFEKLK